MTIFTRIVEFFKFLFGTAQSELDLQSKYQNLIDTRTKRYDNMILAKKALEEIENELIERTQKIKEQVHGH